MAAVTHEIYQQRPAWNAERSGFGFQGQCMQTLRTPDQIFGWVKTLTSPCLSDRWDALQTLSAQREQIPDLAVHVWESPATVMALLAEILSVYPHLVATAQNSSATPPSLCART